MIRLRSPWWILPIVPVLLAGFWLVRSSRASTESPKYEIVRKEGRFEIRDYPTLTVATTGMEATEENGSFGRLFRFITGKNEKAEKISMTTPVLIDSRVGQRTMSFIMPHATTQGGVPKPSGGDVTLREVPAARYAVLRFSGGRNRPNEESAVKKLRSWMKAAGLIAADEPLFGYYDPPWTPVFLRRNEALIRIAPSSKPAANHES